MGTAVGEMPKSFSILCLTWSPLANAAYASVAPVEWAERQPQERNFFL